MVKIRLRRTGKKDQPSYRIVVADSRSPRDGRFIENLGHYNPLTEPETVVFDRARALEWVAQGAQPTDAVARMLRRAGIYDALPRFHAGESAEALFPADVPAVSQPDSPRTTTVAPAKAEAPVAEVASEETVEVAAEVPSEETVAEEVEPVDTTDESAAAEDVESADAPAEG